MKWMFGLMVFFTLFQAAADCGNRLEIDAINLPWSGAKIEERESLKIKSGTRTNGQCNRYYIGFGKGGENLYARQLRSATGAKIAYNLYANSEARGLLKDLPEASKNDVLEGKWHSSRPNQIASRNFWIQVPEYNQIPAAGVYEDTLRLNLYHHKLAQNYLDTFTNLPIKLIIPEQVALSLVDVGGRFDENDTTHTLNFGELGPGKTERMDIRVRANLGHRLYLSSLNNGALKHVRASDTVRYELKIKGRSVSLSGSAARPVLAGEEMSATPEVGSLYEVGVTIGETGSRLAGDYRDVITVSVEAI